MKLTQMIAYMEGYGIDRNQIYKKTGGMFSNHDERMYERFRQVDDFIKRMKKHNMTIDQFF